MDNINLLKHKNIEQPNDDFVDQIIRASYQIEQQQPIGKLLMTILTELKIPNPIYSCALLLMIGFFMGAMNNQSIDETTTITQLYQYEQYEELL